MAEQSDNNGKLSPVSGQGELASPAPVSPASWLAQNALFFAILGIGAGWLWMKQGPMALVQAALVIAGLGLVIFVHELGHFLAAKGCDVYVKTFSIGFGPALPGCSFRWGETLYMVGALPLGGYVQMVGEGTEEEDDNPRSFKKKTVLQRMLIISAGVIMNILFGLFCFLLVFRTQGLRQVDPTVWLVASGGPAWKAGMRSGATVESINGKPIASFDDLRMEVALSRGGVPLDFRVKQSDGSNETLSIAPVRGPHQKNPVIGIAKTPGGLLDLISPPPRGEVEGPYYPGSAAAVSRALPWPADKYPSAWGETIADKLLPSKERLALAEELSKALLSAPGKSLRIRLAQNEGGELEWPMDGFRFNDKVVAMSDLANTLDPFQLIPLKDYSDFRKRLQECAGKPIVLEVERKPATVNKDEKPATEGTRVRILVPAALRRVLPGRLGMGLVAALRDGSPAAQMDIQEGDKLTKLEVLTADDKPSAILDLTSGAVDPLGLPQRLREKVKAAGPGAKVRVSLNREHKHQESKPLEAPITLKWDTLWGNSEESAVYPDSPMSIPELGIAFRVETVVTLAGEKSPLKTGDRIEMVAIQPNPQSAESKGKAAKDGERLTVPEKPAIRWVDLATKAGGAGKPTAGIEPRLDQGAWLDEQIQDQRVSGVGRSEILLKVRRSGELLEVSVPAGVDTERGMVERGFIFQEDWHIEKAETLGQALWMGWHQTRRWVQTIYMNIARIFTRDISTDSLGGPIEIAAQAFSAAQDPLLLVLFLGIISINLAVVNFLPIPLLDGGHMVFLLYEAVARRAPPAWVSAGANYVGLLFILSLFAFVIYNDLKRRVFGQ